MTTTSIESTGGKNALERLGEKARFEPTGLALHGKLSFDEWMGLGAQLLHIEKSRLFWVGDWVNYGESHFGEKYAQALEHTDYSYGTLRNAAYTCARIPRHARNPNLSFNHHYAVAKLSEKPRDKLLKEAAEQELTVQEIRDEADRSLGRPPTSQKGKKEFEVWFHEWVRDNWQEYEPKGNVTMSTQRVHDIMGQAWFAGQVNK